MVVAALERPGLTLLGTERIGTGQMSQNHRVRFRGAAADPESVVVKLASDDATSRATGVGLGAYSREISFYSRLAPRIGGPLATCHLAAYDSAEGGSRSCSPTPPTPFRVIRSPAAARQAAIALRALAQIQAPVLGDIALGTSDYLNLPNPLNQALVAHLWPGFLERYDGRISDEHAAVCEAFIPRLDALAADRRPPLGLVHGDYRLDNLLFAGDRCTVVDWQTMSWGPTMIDVSYFVGGGLSVQVRRAEEESLVRLYHEELLARGVEGFRWEACWRGTGARSSAGW